MNILADNRFTLKLPLLVLSDSHVQLSKPQKGINIIDGKKVPRHSLISGETKECPCREGNNRDLTALMEVRDALLALSL